MNARERLVLIVVDDLPEARIIVDDAARELSEERNLELVVREYREPASAVQAAAKERPDIVVMDFQTAKGLNGWEAACEIHGQTGADVIIFTGSPEAANKNAKIRPLPGAVIVGKPAARYQMKDHLRQLINKRHIAKDGAGGLIDYAEPAFVHKMARHFGEARQSAIEHKR